jgi:two-component system response regulator EvgA
VNRPEQQRAAWRALIVESDPIVARAHRHALASVRMQCVGVAETGKQAVQLIAQRAPHLLLLDLALPGIDGIKLLGRIRAAGGRVEAIAVTARRDRDSVQRSLKRSACQRSSRTQTAPNGWRPASRSCFCPKRCTSSTPRTAGGC